MKLSLAEPKYLKESISIISELVSEARFKITKESIELIAMDPANVAMVIFKMFSSAFVEYDVEDEVNVAINLGNLKQILKRAKATDTVTIELDEEKNKLITKLKGKSSRTFSLPIIELEEKEQKVPQLSFPVTIKANSADILEAIDDVDIVAESVSFTVEDNKFTVEGEGDLSKAKVDISADDDTEIKSETGEKYKSKYSIEYLKKMISGSKISDTVEINFSKNYPVKMSFVDVDKVMLSFILAPRVDND